MSQTSNALPTSGGATLAEIILAFATAILMAQSIHSASSSVVQNRADIVSTADGPVKGRIRQDVRQFLGIPFAAPPVGDLRWRPPQSHASWRDPVDAVAFGPTCAQRAAHHGFGAASEQEDCLYLNVFTPNKTVPASRWPVMVWIHGGGLFAGASTDYDPRKLVIEGDVVVVSFNYRLNIFGFFAHPALDHEGHAVGNYGLMDQQFALQWVQRNIAAFGGNPRNITIFGESAGGWSVLAHMASPKSRALFHRAISESGGNVGARPLPEAQTVGLKFAAAVGCVQPEAAACLRSTGTRKILETNAPGPSPGVGRSGTQGGEFSVGLIIDGDIIPQAPRAAFAAGAIHRVPFLSVTNRDEQTWFVALTELTTGHIIAPTEYAQAIGGQFGANAPAVLERYPLNNYQTPSNALAAAVGDRGFICGTRRSVRAASRVVNQTYAGEFDVRDTPVNTPSVSFPYLAAHTSELQYLFAGYHGAAGPVHELNAAQHRLSDRMVRYWTAFARTGSPNVAQSDATEFWPRYQETLDNYYSLRTSGPAILAPFGDTHQCTFWDSIDR